MDRVAKNLIMGGGSGGDGVLSAVVEANDGDGFADSGDGFDDG